MRAGEVSEDDERHAVDEVEKLTHAHTDRIEALSKKKEQELMDV
jgi:ribosome recycling factor